MEGDKNALYLCILKKRQFDSFDETKIGSESEIIKLLEDGIGILTRRNRPPGVFYFHKFKSSLDILGNVNPKKLAFTDYKQLGQSVVKNFGTGFLSPFKGGVFVSMAISQFVYSNEDFDTQTKEMIRAKISKIVMTGVDAIQKMVASVARLDQDQTPLVVSKKEFTTDEVCHEIALAQFNKQWMLEPSQQISESSLFNLRLVALTQLSPTILEDVECEVFKVYNAIWNAIGVDFCVEGASFVFLTSKTLRKYDDAVRPKKFIPRLCPIDELYPLVKNDQYVEPLIVNEKTMMDVHEIVLAPYAKTIVILTPSTATEEWRTSFADFIKKMGDYKITKPLKKQTARETTTHTTVSRFKRPDVITEDQAKENTLRDAVEFDANHGAKNVAVKLVTGMMADAKLDEIKVEPQDIPEPVSASDKKVKLFDGNQFMSALLFKMDLENLGRADTAEWNVLRSLLYSYEDSDLVITNSRLMPFDINTSETFFIYRPSAKRIFS